MADSLMTPTTKQGSKMTGAQDKKSTAPSNQVKKLQCDLCKLSYPTEKELKEHLVSLMHHNKLEDKIKNVPHACCLCGFTCFAMSEYRTHIATEKHQKKLSALKGENETGGKFQREKNRLNRNYEDSDFQRDFPRSKFSTYSNGSHTDTYPNDQPRGTLPKWQERQQYNQRFYQEPRGSFSDSRGIRWQRRMEYEPWGSGVFGSYAKNNTYRPYAFYFRGNRGGRIVSKERISFNDSIDFTSDDWDENSLNRQEQLLADMSSEPYHSAHSMKFGEDDRHVSMTEVNGRDRKRPRNDDDIEESLPKSSKSNTKSSAESSYVLQADRLDGLSLMPFTDKSLSSSKMSLTDASDSILEKAERLCKELRHKSLEDKFSKTKMQDRVSTEKSDKLKGKNDVQNKYDKNISNALEQHSEHSSVKKTSLNNIGSVSKTADMFSLSDKVSKEDILSTESYSRVSPTNKEAANFEITGKNSPNSLNQNVQQKYLSSPTRQSTAAESMRPTTTAEVMLQSSKASSSSKPSGSLLEQQSKNRQRSLSAEYGAETTTDLPSKALQKSTVKSISIDHLQKLVNAPRSRDERLQLAKMLHSREEHKSSALRSNLQLEGLYDSELGDAGLDLDNISNELTIKVEDISDGLRQQLMELIGEDIRAIFDNSNSGTSAPSSGAAPSSGTAPSDSDRQRNRSSSPLVLRENTFSDPQGASAPLHKKKKKVTVQVNVPTESNQSTQIKPRATHKDLTPNHSKNTVDKESPADTLDLDLDCRKINSDKRFKRDSSRETAHSTITTDIQPRSPLKGLGVNSSPSVSKGTTSSHKHTDLNMENVNVRYPTIMDITRSDKATRSHSPPASLQAQDSPSLSKNPAISATLSSADSPALCSSSSALSQSAEVLYSYKQLSLPPSTWLAERESTVTNSRDRELANSPTSDLSERLGPNSSTSLKSDNTVIDISEEAEYATPQPPDTVPAELLRLSERDEDIKQEMVSLDLRLTRLHRLLEQAVFQITKCTERRSQLLEETQVISNKRITLLRETAAVRLRGHTRELSFNAQMESSTSSSKESTCLPETSDGRTAMENAQENSGMSLSKEDWLAKFSSFLPPEPVLEARTSGAPPSEPTSNRATDLASPHLDQSILQLEHNPHQSVLMATGKKNSDSVLSMSPVQRHQSMDNIARKSSEMSPSDSLVQKRQADRTASKNDKVTSAQPVTEAYPNEVPENTLTASTFQSISNIFSRPLVYLGSFKSAETLPLRTPVILMNDSPNLPRPTTANKTGTKGSVIQSTASKALASNTAIEDSDPEGSNCTGSASESSLGEKISRYCQNTPDASLGSTGHAKSFAGYQRKKSINALVRPCSVSLSRVDDILKETSCILDKKTAEALHLLERNSQNDGPGSAANSSKKKKMLTRHERVISGMRRRMRQRILSSSSSDEAGVDLSNETNSKSPAEPVRSLIPISKHKDKSPKSSKQNSTGALREVMKMELSPSKATSVVIAECDSSTNIGVDKESLTQRLKSLKEMRENFDKAFGHSASSIVASNRATVSGSNGAMTADTEHALLLSDTETFPELNQSGDTRIKAGLDFQGNLRQVDSRRAFENSLEGEVTESDLKDRMSRFPGNYGPVVDLHVLHLNLYVAYHSYGVSIYNLNESNKNPHEELICPGLHCMTVVQLQGLVKVITGCGFQLVFFISEKDNNRQVSYDMGTTVKCMSVMGTLVYCGLETGEICIFDTTKMELKDRFICSDHPIHCLAFAQEGSSRLICASSQDGTILVVNALTGLPLRILTGHSKTAFSLAVQGQFVFSGSGDSTVISHNIHTGAIIDVISDNKGLVKTVFYHQGFLFTGGMDRLVRCYDMKKNCKLIQVYYGADRTVICKILVHNNMLFTGNTTGAVDCVQLDLQAQNLCHKSGCNLNFGSRSHLFWHILEDHNITEQKKEPIVLN